MNNKSTDQLDRFKEAARKLEADDDEERFNEKFKKLATAKPQVTEEWIAEAEKLVTEKKRN